MAAEVFFVYCGWHQAWCWGSGGTNRYLVGSAQGVRNLGQPGRRRPRGKEVTLNSGTGASELTSLLRAEFLARKLPPAPEEGLPEDSVAPAPGCCGEQAPCRVHAFASEWSHMSHVDMGQ